MSRYSLVSPVRNEIRNIEATLKSVIAQKVRPDAWVIVDDGSTDGTPDLVLRYVQAHPWITLIRLKDRGHYDLMEGGEIKAFYAGLSTINVSCCAFIGKLDGDISFDEHYYARLLQRFASDPRLGIGSGVCWFQGKTRPVFEQNYAEHARGAMRLYRKQCWDEIGGVIRMLGWDSIDCYKARMLGWRTRSFTELPVRHHVPTWTKGGLLHGRRRSGRLEYLMGTHPLFFTAKCLREILSTPYFVAAGALTWGYLQSALKREERVSTPELTRYIRKEQMARILAACGGRARFMRIAGSGNQPAT